MTDRLKPENETLLGNRDMIVALIEHGFAQAERGELIDGDDVKALLSARCAAQRHESIRQKI